MDKKYLVIVIAAALFLSVVIFYAPTDNWNWDPSFYYAQIRSPIIENDLDFRNETNTRDINLPPTVTGLQPSVWPIGPSILWSPFFLVAHLFVSIFIPIKANGFSIPYIALVSFGSSLYGLVGLFVLYRICRFYGGKYLSTLTVLITLFAPPLFYYIYRQPIMPHSTGFFTATILFLVYILLIKGQINKVLSGLLFGVLLGLAVLIRWAGILVIIFPLAYYLSEIVSSIKQKDGHDLRLLFIQIFVAISCFILTISPQLALWQRLYGNFLVMPQGADTFVQNLLPINLFKVLFDTNRGILFWCPFLLIGMVGTIRIPERKIRIPSMLFLISQLIILGYRVDWFSGGGFGARYFVELLPIIAVGFMCLVKELSLKPVGKAALTSLGIVLIIHQFVLVYSVEQAINNWVNFANYLKGKPLGKRWQLESMIRLFNNPRLWFAIRPYTSILRQAILVNLLSGVRDYRAYLISATAAVLTPFAVLVIYRLKSIKQIVFLQYIPIGVILFMVGWAVYLLFVGS
jgi:4-amino-4-deoxy-L-arabinose transferase-like glycosyltransferase